MDLTAFASPAGYIASVSVAAIIAAGAATFLPRIAMATVRWARSLIDGGSSYDDDDIDDDWLHEQNGTGRWTKDN